MNKATTWVVAALAWMLSPLILEQGFWWYMIGLLCLLVLSLYVLPSWWRVFPMEYPKHTVKHRGKQKHCPVCQQTRHSGSSISSAPTSGTAEMRWPSPDASQAQTISLETTGAAIWERSKSLGDTTPGDSSHMDGDTKTL